jgi:hypothetical protein
MAYDPVSGKIVLFGGGDAAHVLHDTWTFDGTTWTKVKTPASPPGRAAAAMAFDQPSGKLVLFGGINTQHLLHDTWLWDGATSTWSKAPVKPAPTRAVGPMLFSNPTSGEAMIFGGFNVRLRVPNLHDTYRWAGEAWQKLDPATAPIGRGWGIAVYDPVRNNVVLTGGEGDTIRTDNTWTWDGTNWTEVSPATQVEDLIGAGSAFDEDLAVAIVFGGFSTAVGKDANETWMWDGTNWNQLAPQKSPSAREGMGLAYDPVHHQVVMFGGERGDSQHVEGDTWTFQ